MQIRRVVPLLHVRDLAASLEFYDGAFGAQVISSWPATGSPRWACVRAGDLTLMLFQSQEELPAQEEGTERMIFYVTVDDVDAAHLRLRDRGFHVTEPADHSHGFREFHLRDPDGNRYALGHGIPVHA